MKSTKIKKILFSQNPPDNFERSPYADFVKKYSIKIDLCKFFKIEGILLKNFLAQNINILTHSAVIFTSKNAIDHFFCIVNESKVSMPSTTKYFCANEGIAEYLRKYGVEYYTQNTHFSKNGCNDELIEKIAQYNSNNFLLPMAMDSSTNQLIKLLDEHKINYTKAEFFKISFVDMNKKIDVYSYDMLVFFSPYGIQSLMHNYSDFQQGDIIIATFGNLTYNAAQNAGLNVQIIAPTTKHPSIFSAIGDYLKKHASRRKNTLKKNP